MIVISGALVLVALVLLIIGVVGPDLTFVYASIAVSLVSLVFLVVGILQRRGETSPAAESGAPAPEVQPADAAGVTAVVPSQEARTSMRRAAQEPPAADTADEELETGGTVLVVEGRPRYHVEGCRYLSGKAAEAVDVLDAREEGFSPCGVCKPDVALAAAEQAEPVEDELLEDPATEELVVEEPADDEPAADEPVVDEDVPGVAPARGAAKRTSSRKAPAKKAPAKAAGGSRAVKAVKAPAAKAPGRAAVKAAPAAAKAPSKAAAAAAPARAGSVVVIPDRGKFHKAQCRFVRDADGTEVMSKSAASRAGYAACGVCKP